MKPSTWSYGTETFSTDHRLFIRVKAGETLYYGVHRTTHTQGSGDQANLTLTLRYGSGTGTVVQTTTLLRNQSSTRHMLLTEGQAGVIINAAEALAGPEVRATTGGTILANAPGYNPLVYTNNTGADRDFYIEFTQANEANMTEGQRFSVYDFWDFTVRSNNQTSGVERPGRLYSKQWAFSAGSTTGMFSSTFSMFPLIASELNAAQYYVKRFDLAGLTPQNFFRFVVNRFGSTTAAGSTFQQRRKSQTTQTDYPEFFTFVNNPDASIWPSASAPTIQVTATSYCNASSGGSVAFTNFSSDPGVFILTIDLNGTAGYQAGTRDVLIETNLPNPGYNTIVWNGVDGLGAVVPLNTPIKTYFKSGAVPVNFPLYDAERNPDGFRTQNIRPVASSTYDLLFWDDTNLPTSRFPAPQFQLEGAISTNGVHRWGTTSDAGDTYTVNTWTYGFITYDTVNFTYNFTCDRDGDGTNDGSDIDDDNDGITDVTEGFGVDPGVLTANGVARYLDASYVHPTLGAFRDANADGVNDWFDTDLDGKPNFLDLDSDGDGVPDAIEANAGVAPANYLNGRIGGTYNSNGMAQSAQTAASSGISNYAMTNTDGDALADLYDRDSDNDGIWDNLEIQATASYRAPLGTDADGDGWDDRYDTSCSPCTTTGVAIVISNKDGTDLADYRDTNSDNDASLDWIEGFDDDKNGYALNDLLARADNFVMLGGNATYYPATDANANGLPDWLDDSNNNGIPNFLDYTSTYFRDTNRNGVIDLFDNAAGQFGAVSIIPRRNAANSDVDFRLNTVVTSLRALTDVAVTNTVAAGPYYTNQDVTYTVTVTNNGPDAATNLVVTDQLPTGLTFISASPATGSYNSTSGNWTIGTLNSGQTVTMTLVGRPQTASSFTTVASVTANDGYDAVTSNNTASNTITVGASADLAVTNTVAAGPYYVGQPVTYTVTVINNGPNAASAVQLTDLLPAGLTFNSASTPSGTSYSSSTGVWTVGTLTSGQSQTLTITATPTAATTYTTTAAISGTPAQFDPVAANNSASNSITVQPTADVVVNKTVSAGPYYNGQAVTFTITATNNGPNSATGIVVRDLLPAGFTYQSAVGSGTTTYSQNSGNWTIGTITNGQMATLTLTAIINTTGSLTNTAQVTASTTFDNNTANNTSSVSLSVLSVSDVALTSTVSAGPYNVNQPVTYTITATNFGPDASAGLVVTNTIPAGLTVQSVSAPAGTSYNAGTGQWSIGALASGAGTTLTVVALPTQTGTYTTSSAVTANTVTDNVASNNSTSQIITVSPTADVSVNVAASPTDPSNTFTNNSPVDFTITVANNGPSTANNVQTTFSLPAGFTFVSVTPGAATYNSATGVWTVTSLTSGQSANIVVRANPPAGSTGTNTYTASASVTATEFDNLLANNSNSATITTGNALDADVAVSITPQPGPYYVGQNVVYTVVASNNGPATADNVAVTTTLPAGLTFVSATPSTGSYSSGVWTIGSMVVNTNPTLTITATPTALGSYTTTATKSAQTNADYVPGNNSSLSVISISPTADVALSSSVSAGPYYVNVPFSYTLTATNNGPSTATNVVIFSPLPTGVEIVSSTLPTGVTYNATTEEFTISSLAVNQSAQIALSLVSTTEGTITKFNTKTSQTQFDNVASNNSTSNTLTIGATSDLAVTNTVSSGPYYTGQNVTYTVTVNNIGPNAATSVSITDLLPAGLDFVSASTANGSYSSGNGVWTIGTVSSGGMATLTLVATPTVAGLVTTTASVSANGSYDPVTTNNSSSNTITVGASTDVAVNISASSGPYYQGQPVTFTVTATNNGPNTATGVTIFDNVPTGISYVSGSGSASQGTINPATGLWSVGTLLPNQTATLTLQAIPQVIGTITATASLYQINENDPVTSNNVSSVTLQSLPSANVEVVSSVASGPYYLNQDVVYTIEVQNFGPRPATNLFVKELLPAGLSFVSASPSTGSYNSSTGIWDIGTLNTGVSQTLTLTAKPTVTGSLPLISKVDSQTEFDPVAANNADSTTITIVGSADLAVTNTVSGGPYYIGQPVTYTVSVSNNGPGTATGVLITDLLPAGLTYNSSVPAAGTSYDAATGEWNVGQLTNGQTKTITITATPNTTGTILTTAEVTATDVYDANLANNSASNSITVGGAADLNVDVTASPGPYNAGDVITFTLNVTNLGPGTATDITIGGTLPTGFVLNSITVSTGVYDLATRVWSISSLDNGDVATMVLQASLTNGGNNTVSATILNQATYDPVSANNTDAVTILIDNEAVYVTNSPINQPDATNSVVIATVSDANGGVVSAALANGTTLPSFVTLNASTGQVTVTNQNAVVPGNYTADILTTDANGGTTVSTINFSITADIEAIYTVVPPRNWYDNPNGSTLASVIDYDGDIVSASISPNTFFGGAIAFNTTTGEITVLQRGLLRPGSYPLTISTTDIFGGVTSHSITIVLTGDRDGDGVDDFTDVDNNNDGITNRDSDYSENAFDRNGNLLIFADQSFVHPKYGVWRDRNADGINDWFDLDLDGIINLFDLDMDGDGILNSIEANGGEIPGNGFSVQTGQFTGTVASGDIAADGLPVGAPASFGTTIDSDSDSHKDFLDLDSDNDGILDIFEGQISDTMPVGLDENLNGIDDAFDPQMSGGNAISVTDIDGDGIPDYLDLDTDADGALDATEGFDDNGSGFALDDLMGRAEQYNERAGAVLYDNTLNQSVLPEWLKDDNENGIRNYLDPTSQYYFDTDNDGLINLFDTDNSGQNSRLPDNDSDGTPDFRDNDLFVPLPVELISFTANAENGNVHLKWVTAQETDNDHFIVERSANGRTFSQIGKVAGNGTTTTVSVYNFTDAQPLAGQSYYRLRQVDGSGDIAYSQVVAVSVERTPATLLVMPNPVREEATVKLDNVGPGEYTILVTNVYGKLILARKLTVTANSFSEKMNLSQLPAGMYLLSITGNGTKLTQQVVKQ